MGQDATVLIVFRDDDEAYIAHTIAKNLGRPRSADHSVLEVLSRHRNGETFELYLEGGIKAVYAELKNVYMNCYDYTDILGVLGAEVEQNAEGAQQYGDRALLDQAGFLAADRLQEILGCTEAVEKASMLDELK